MTVVSTPASTTYTEMTIGEVLAKLQPDFPDVTISKIRFLEAEGLIEPHRSASGYRKFRATDLDRLRYVLAAQRDHYLPLRVIKDHLDAMDRGLEPPVIGLPGPRVPAALAAPVASGAEESFVAFTSGDVRLSRSELLEASGLTGELLTELEAFGLIGTREGEYFDENGLSIAKTVAELCGYGLQPRHLRPFKTAADRELGLIEQLVAPLTGQRRAQAEEVSQAVAALSVRLHATLVRSGLRALPSR